jgi:hypothetical protein
MTIVLLLLLSVMMMMMKASDAIVAGIVSFSRYAPS